jgi:hypothetical protein
MLERYQSGEFNVLDGISAPARESPSRGAPLELTTLRGGLNG